MKWPRGGQTEIDLKFDSLVRSADKMLLYKYIVKNVANRYGKDGHVHAQADFWR